MLLLCPRVHSREGLRRSATSLFSRETGLDLIYGAELPARGVITHGGLCLRGRPNIQNLGGRIELGKDVVLWSRDAGYHTRISPTRLVVSGGGSIVIGDRSRLNGASLQAKLSIRIGADTYIAAGTNILDCDAHTLDAAARVRGEGDTPDPIVIGNRVWIGLNTIILKGVTIGDDCVVGAGSVVTRDLPPSTLCGGVPARVLRSL